MSKVVKGAELKAKKDIEQFKTESNEVIKNLKNENAATEKQFEDFKKDSEKTIQDKFLMDQLLMHQSLFSPWPRLNGTIDLFSDW